MYMQHPLYNCIISNKWRSPIRLSASDGLVRLGSVGNVFLWCWETGRRVKINIVIF